MYQVFIQYPRSIQEAFKIISNRIYNNDNDEAVVTTIYRLYPGVLQGEKIQHTDTIRIYEKNNDTPFLICSLDCIIPDDKLNDKQGVWDIEVERNGQLIDSGEYKYDLREAPILNDDIGLDVYLYTKEELIELFKNNPGSTKPYKFGWRITAEKNKFFNQFPDAKYTSSRIDFMKGTVTSFPPGRTMDDFKVLYSPRFYTRVPDVISPIYITNERITLSSGLSLQSDPEFEDYRVADMFIFIGIYDEDFHLIGQFIAVAQFDQDHVPDGYIAEQNWQPES